ncbi:prolyl oligopeptidase family serine peptidase [Denitrificimonas sp. JX-1]|uniref:Prolyl oligopeptidase family serine peptidase n=1 Tax=Denitrificimonas halotolerans TaxID=3098930 RepID=A0ABU5GTM5_9GAMM|nr:prolyl oligopeptidase family serine peptidase [Denitrificimonas sp. JX-1]MDY7220342.1 prolyl oligopeptidase family serine peptidase [Denitrificimonas sp. JX-1]
MPCKETVAAGFWPSAWSAEQAAVASCEINELKVAEQGVFWTVFDPQTALTRVFRYQPELQFSACFTPEGFSVRSRVYEYGGGAFCLTEQGVVFTNEVDQQLYLQTWQGTPQALTARDLCRYADMQYDPLTHTVLAVEEEHCEQGVLHRLVRVSLALTPMQELAEPQVVAQGSDFYAAPRLSPDGQRLLWIEWQRPDQPWTQTQLFCAQRQEDGGWGAFECVAGAQGNAAIQQPLFDQEQRIVALNDEAGYWQPWREQVSTGLVRLKGIEADYAGAPWQLGGCNYVPLEGDLYLISWFSDGVGRMALYCFARQKILHELATEFTRSRHLAVDADCFYCIAGHSSQGSAVLAIDRRTLQQRVLTQIPLGLPKEHVSIPQGVYFYTAKQAKVHSFFYPAHNIAQSLAEQERPPLVVFLHGGPTSACYPVFDSRIQYWTQRGFAVADLNYRGSTGFGRQYRQCLQQQWGVLEIEDICALVQHLIVTERVHPQHIFIRGASAGGYSALLAVANTDYFAGAASLYGVSDPAALNKVTHKFEGDYLDWLLGAAQVCSSRIPVRLAQHIQTPVIFFQGGRDVVVVQEQTAMMVQVLTDQNVDVEYHLYPEEGHGFRKAQHLAEVLKLELAFYQRILLSLKASTV